MRRATAYTLSERERRNLSLLVDYSEVQSLPEIWAIAAQRFSQATALHDPHSKPEVRLTFSELNQQLQQFAAGLQVLGVKQGELISLFSDNSPRWFVADQGMMAAGAANAVRSSQAEREELLFILENSGSTGLVVEDRATLKKLRDRLNSLPIRFVILLSNESPDDENGLKVVNFNQLMDLGANQAPQPVSQDHDALATLIYTSGTTGKPKGVMLSHGNLLHQVTTFGVVVQPKPGDRALGILPTWHSYERSVEYFLLSQGCTQVYTSIRTIKKDLKQYKPNYMVSVPRIWESVYEGVQKQFREQPANKQKLINFFLKASQQYIEANRLAQNLDLQYQNPPMVERMLAEIRAAFLYPLHALGEKMIYKTVRDTVTGGEFRYAISGGGSLAKHLDDFFEIVGIGVLVGYGLTETSPVTNVRRPWHNLRGSSGPPIPGTEIRIVDPETRQPLLQGEKGLVLIRGPQVMQGYYQNPEATKKAIDPEGWFDSGDLGWINRQNDLILTGRAKDTIVLTNGENIEPQPIEDACLRSPYIDQIMLVGQDQKVLGALIVPNLEALQKWGGEGRGQKAEGRGQEADAEMERQEAEDRGQQEDAGTRGRGDAETSAIQNSKFKIQNSSPPPNTLSLDSKPLQDLIRQELNREVQNRPGFRIDDRIGPFRLLLEPFSMENGMLTQTLKIRRNVVMDRYQGMINEMFV